MIAIGITLAVAYLGGAIALGRWLNRIGDPTEED